MPSLGRLAYLLWFQPTGILRRLATSEGLRDATIARWAAGEMRQQALRLGGICAPNGFPVHFLTGRGFWHLTAFASHSLLHTCRVPLRLIFEDDGSLDAETSARLTAAFPGSRIVTEREQRSRLDEFLPSARFPTLRRDLENFLLLRKLTAPHLGAHGARLVLDSDVLFFSPPVALESWIRKNAGDLLHMVDVDDQYGCPRQLLAEISVQDVPPRVNTGVVGLASERIDWERMEAWAHTYLTRVGPTHFLEQSLTAILAGRMPHTGLPASDYVVAPTLTEAKRPSAVAHHYAGPSRHLLYRHGWRHILAAGRRALEQPPTTATSL